MESRPVPEVPSSEPDAAGGDGRTGRVLVHDVGISAGVAGLFLLLRVMAVAGWNWHTASLVAETMDFGDAVSIVLGTLFAEPTLTGILVMLLLPLTAVALIRQGGDARRRIPLLLFLGGLTVVAAALTSGLHQYWLPGGAGALAVALYVTERVWRRGARRRAVLLLLHSVGWLAIGAALVLATAVATPWMAREHITTTAGTIDGYVLETPSGYLKVLTANPREVVVLLTGNVTSRTIADN